MTWGRIQRLELEISTLQAEVKKLNEQLDTARSVATHAVEVCAVCGSQLAWVPYKGEAH